MHTPHGDQRFACLGTGMEDVATRACAVVRFLLGLLGLTGTMARAFCSMAGPGGAGCCFFLDARAVGGGIGNADASHKLSRITATHENMKQFTNQTIGLLLGHYLGFGSSGFL